MTERVAIAVMSFDRPHYVERVLQTVLAQQPMRRLVPVFHLFQDGCVSPRTGNVYGKAELMEKSVAVFRHYLPRGHVHQSPVNLGVALNFDRAERMLFEDHGYACAIFLEDDLLLQPWYFRVMEELLDLAATREDVGMVAAFGFDKEMPLAEQRRRERDLVLMDEHNWAFGMRREAWAARDRVLRPYLGIVSQIDYRDRDRGEPKAAIKAMQLAYGRHGRGYLSSQDSTKNLALELLGLHRITTFTNNARYIGKEGLHSTPARFAAQGHGRTVVYDRPHGGFVLPLPETLRAMRLGLQHR